MQALIKIKEGKGHVQLREVAEPQWREGMVLIKVAYAGLCGSDLHILHNDIALRMKPPVIIGHEFSGYVVKGKYPEGTSVVSETAFSFCRQCENCVSGNYHQCESKQILGYFHNGCFAPYVLVPERNVYQIPQGVSMKVATMTEPLACCVHALYEVGHIERGSDVLVIGAGTIGQLCAQLAHHAGASVTVIGTANSSHRLAIASSLGFEVGIDLPDRRFDTVIECSGSSQGTQNALLMAKRMGTVILMAFDKTPIDTSIISYHELNILGSISSKNTSWMKSLLLLPHLNLEPLILNERPLAQWKQSFEDFEKGKGLKTLFVM